MKLLILLLFFILSVSTYGQQKSLSANQKETDFLYLHDVLCNNYPYFGVFKRKSGTNWLSNKQEYIRRLKGTRTDRAYITELELILSELGCKHLDLSPTHHWNKFRQIYGEVSLYNPDYMHWVNVLNQEAEKISYWSKLLNNNDLIPTKHDEILEPSNYKDSITPDKRIAIMRIASFEVKYLEADFCRIDSFISSLKQTDFLIIDLQGNRGGTTQYWMKSIVNRLISFPIDFTRNLVIKDGINNRHFYPFYHENGKTLKKDTDLLQIPKEFMDGSFLLIKESSTIYPFMPFDVHGNIIILIDEKTSSAADEFAVFCKSTGWATVVGNTSGGGGIGGDPVLLQLPQSGIIIRYPALTGFNPDGSLNMEVCTTPNIQIEGKNADEKLENLIQILTKLIQKKTL